MISFYLYFRILFFLILFLFTASQNSNAQQWILAGSVSNPGLEPSISVVDGNTAFVVGGAPDTPRVYRTTNGGVNWTQFPTTGISKELYCVWGVNSTTLFAGEGVINGGARLFKTTNAGVNWTVLATTGNNQGYFNGLVFSRSNPQLGGAMAEKMFLTTDGGVSWTEISPGVSGVSSAQNSFMLIDQTFFGFGLNNGAARVRVSTDGGSSWSSHAVNLTGSYTSGFTYKDDKLTGLASTSSSMPNISRTTDDGTSWVAMSIGAGLTGNTFIKWIPGTNVVYIIGSNGAVKRSTDSGLNWTSMTTPSITGITHFDFIKLSNVIFGFAVSTNGSVMKLADSVLVPPPAPPTLLSPPNGSVCQSLTPLLDWNDVPTAASYRVQVSTDTGFTTTVIDVSGLTASQYSVGSGILTNNRLYYWHVSASNGGGTSNFSSRFSFRTLITAPALLLPLNGATNIILTPLLDWTDVTDNNSRNLSDIVVTYGVQVSTDSNFTTLVVDTNGLAVSQYTVPSGRLNYNTLYYWRASASEAGCSGTSSRFRFTTVPPPPAGLNLTVIPGGFYNTATGRLNMRDTIRVYLVDSVTCTRVDSARGVLDSVTFSMPVSFSIAATGNYYVFIYHRNHLTIASRLRQNIIRGSNVSYDFTTDSAKAYGYNMIKVSNSPVRWGMIPGDANQDGFVDGLDQTIWIAENGLDGYLPADFNGDSFVDGLDQTIWILQNGQSTFLPCGFDGALSKIRKQ